MKFKHLLTNACNEKYVNKLTDFDSLTMYVDPYLTFFSVRYTQF